MEGRGNLPVNSQSTAVAGNSIAESFTTKALNDLVRPNPPQQQDLQCATTEMFTKVSKYLGAELATTVADYNLLTQMNNVTASKYHDMTEITKGLTMFMSDLKIKYEEFQPYLEKINELDKNVGDLEKTVQLIDEYTRRLENKIKNIDKSALLPPKLQQSTAAATTVVASTPAAVVPPVVAPTTTTTTTPTTTSQ
eukprot:gene15629-18569_t